MSFIIKQGDTSPALAATLLAPDKSAVNLTDATVLFHMRNSRGTGTPLVGNAEVTDAATGAVRYVWGPTDTATVGDYEAEFQVTFADGSVETFPNDGYMEVSISEQIA